MVLHGNSLQKKACKLHFLTLWLKPTTLTQNPSLLKVNVNSHAKNQGHRWKWFGRESAHRQTHRETQKNGTDSITLTTDVRREVMISQYVICTSHTCVSLNMWSIELHFLMSFANFYICPLKTRLIDHDYITIQLYLYGLTTQCKINY